jgi:hypothetical protein
MQFLVIGNKMEPRRQEEREGMSLNAKGIPFAPFKKLRGLRLFAVKKTAPKGEIIMV